MFHCPRVSSVHGYQNWELSRILPPRPSANRDPSELQLTKAWRKLQVCVVHTQCIGANTQSRNTRSYTSSRRPLRLLLLLLRRWEVWVTSLQCLPSFVLSLTRSSSILGKMRFVPSTLLLCQTTEVVYRVILVFLLESIIFSTPLIKSCML